MTDDPCMPFGRLLIAYDATGLRPRPWTQLQSAWAAELLRGLPEGDVLELCSGAGQIGLLALVETDRSETPARRGRHLVQVDADEPVCRLAERNARHAGMAERVDVRCGAPGDRLGPEERFVLVIADPPWVPSDRVSAYPDDPPSAIDGGPDGLEVVRALLPVIDHHLAPDGAALLQLGGPDQVDRVRLILDSAGGAMRVTESRVAPGTDDGAVALLTRPGARRSRQ